MTARLSGICSAVCGRCSGKNDFAIMHFGVDRDCGSGCVWVDEAAQHVEMDHRVLGASHGQKYYRFCRRYHESMTVKGLDELGGLLSNYTNGYIAGYTKALLDVQEYIKSHSGALKKAKLYNSRAIEKLIDALVENRVEMRETGTVNLWYNRTLGTFERGEEHKERMKNT